MESQPHPQQPHPPRQSHFPRQSHHPAHDDIVTMFNKHMHGTVEQGVSKKWLHGLEELILQFLGKLFDVKGFEKLAATMNNKALDVCVKSSKIKDTDVLLFNIAHLLNELPESLLNETLPLLANLLFMSKHNFSLVKTSEAKKIVAKFQERINVPSYLTVEQPEIKLTKLIDIVDSIRKYAEYLLRVDGYSLKIGRSPREILRTIHKVRSDNTI